MEITTTNVVAAILSGEKDPTKPLQFLFESQVCPVFGTTIKKEGSFQVDLKESGVKFISMDFTGRYITSIYLPDGNWCSLVYADKNPYRLGLQGIYSDVGIQPFLEATSELVALIKAASVVLKPVEARFV